MYLDQYVTIKRPALLVLDAGVIVTLLERDGLLFYDEQVALGQ